MNEQEVSVAADVEKTTELDRRNDRCELDKLSRRWLISFGMLQGLIIVGSAFLPTLDLTYFSCQLVFAVMLGESALAAIWLVMGPGKLVKRIIGAPFWIVASAGLAGLIERPDEAFRILLTIGAALALVFVLLLLFLSWSIAIELRRKNSEVATESFQFGMIHWFVLTLCIAVLLGLGRFIVTGKQFHLQHNELVISLVIGTSWALALLPAVFVPLWKAPGKRLIIGFALSAILLVVSATTNAIMVSQIIPELRQKNTPVPSFLVIVPALAGVLVAVSLLLIRAAEYRLTRRSRS